MPQEIERKWLLHKIPQEQPFQTDLIKQDYIIATDKHEVRVRHITPCYANGNIKPNGIILYSLTIKTSGDLVREEVETLLLQDQYQILVDKCCKPIFKLRRKYYCGNRIVEVSVVDDSWIYAEVEFENEDEAQRYHFPWPELVIEEVTYNQFYKMKNYWHRKFI